MVGDSGRTMSQVLRDMAAERPTAPASGRGSFSGSFSLIDDGGDRADDVGRFMVEWAPEPLRGRARAPK
jgi:hypothetical protein